MKKIILCLLCVCFLHEGWAKGQFSDPGYISPSSLKEFCDGLLSGLLAEHEIPGAVLVVIKDGETLFAKGYGYADVANTTPVNPENTLFRIGSISKLLIWTSLMQLYEKGQLDLNADIGQYIGDFPINRKTGQRITIKNLMSHTAGFEDKFLGVMGKDENSLIPLEELLTKEMPSMVRPPNSQASYSNHGSALAALIVEKVSGMDFFDYVEEHIFTPLDMDQSTLRQPLPEGLRPYLSHGYSSTADPEPKDFEFIRVYPAGAMSSTGADMAKWVKVYLGEGTLKGTTILDTTTFREMVQPAFSHHPAINPMLHGFLDLSRNNLKAYGHFGDTFWFHSMMLMVPESQIGIFLSLNGSMGSLTYLRFYEQFMEHLMPSSAAEEMEEISLSDSYFDQLEGDYKMNRYARSDLTKIASLFARYKVSRKSEKFLNVSSPLGTMIYHPVDSLVFQKSGTSEKIAFGKGEKGKVGVFYSDLMPMIVMEKVAWHENQSLHLTVFFTALLSCCFTLLFWPMVFVSRRRFYPSDPNRRYLPFSSKLLAWINALLFLCFVIGVFTILEDPLSLLVAIPASLKVLLVIPLLFSIISLLMFVHGLKIFEIAAISLRTKLFYFILVLIYVSVVVQLYYWNLLGWQY